ncbi:hypothetical protein TREES_T100010099 [Tupaia chinensis]|uniref:Uncharacterized protein n=1 Tax=Tupaia chinensis TaxID=246437 RepID=L9JCF6_TUPCH|nr:hypothetical protein TREES_T100010099 [Tupaia chinensis]
MIRSKGSGRVCVDLAPTASQITGSVEAKPCGSHVSFQYRYLGPGPPVWDQTSLDREGYRRYSPEAGELHCAPVTDLE